jgi:hypothetical protein
MGRCIAPIYRQLGFSSVSYSLWLCNPCLTRDSLYQVLNEVVKPKVTYETQPLTETQGEAGHEAAARAGDPQVRLGAASGPRPFTPGGRKGRCP